MTFPDVSVLVTVCGLTYLVARVIDAGVAWAFAVWRARGLR